MRKIFSAYLVSSSLALSLLSPTSYGAAVLPPEFEEPKEPRPGASTCSSCKAAKSQDAESKESPALTKRGRARLIVPIDPEPFIKHGLLNIDLGGFAFQPSDLFQIIMPGGDPKNQSVPYIEARIGTSKAGFEPTAVNCSDNQVFRSINNVNYFMRREADSLVVGSIKSPIEYLFSSKDGGMRWRLMTARDKRCPSKAVTCEYTKDGLMSGIMSSQEAPSSPWSTPRGSRRK